MQVYSVDKLMSEARRLAVEYRRATGRPLAIGGEIAKHDAIRLLDLVPAPAGANGHDALGTGARSGIRYQIKNRAIFEGKSGQRLGQINMTQQWDRVVLVLFDSQFVAIEIYGATRQALASTAARTGKHDQRAPLSVARFKHIARLVWSAELGLTDPGYAKNSPSHVEGS